MMIRVLAIPLASLLVGVACHRPIAPAATTTPAPARDWLAQEPAVCQAISGRVLSALTGAPMPGAAVVVAHPPLTVRTDSLGRFRIPLRPMVGGIADTAKVDLRVARVGYSGFDFRLFLAPSYVLEIVLAPIGFHADHISTLRIKDPGYCRRAN